MSVKQIQTTDFKTLLKGNFRNYIMFILLIVIMIVFALLTEGTNLSPRTFFNLFIQNAHVIILAVGMVQIIITQNIDLSVGSTCAFIGALSVMVFNLCFNAPWIPSSLAMPIAILAAIAIGVAIGAYHGAWVAFAKLPAFIVTLSSMMLFRGLTYIITKVSPQRAVDVSYSRFSTGILDEMWGIKKVGAYFPLAFIFALVILAAFIVSEFIARKKKITNGIEVTPIGFFIGKLVLVSALVLLLAERFAAYRGLPVVVIVLGITIFAFHFMLKNTVLGRYIYAVGGNPRSAKLSGINSEMVIFTVFCIMGGLTGLAAVVFAGYMNMALPDAGNLFELDAIASCYIGGVSAGGGIGSVIGVVVGGLVMGVINTGMQIRMMSVHATYVVKALILIFAVFLDVYSRRKAGLG